MSLLLNKEQLSAAAVSARVMFAKFSRLLCQNVWFWVCSTILTIFETIACSYYSSHKEISFSFQIVLLVLSSIFWVLQLVGEASTKKADIDFPYGGTKTKSIFERIKRSFFYFLTRGEYVLEGSCLCFGWCCIFYRPGLAALRCFRLFRILWYYEVPPVIEGGRKFASITFGYFGYDEYGCHFVSLIFKVMEFTSKSLVAFGSELFVLTDRTRGALFLTIMFGFCAFILGIVLNIEVGNPKSQYCYTNGTCMYTLLRLSFLDGNGLDFMFTLAAQHPFLFAVLIIYLFLTAFGIINGLIGIFAGTISGVSDGVFLNDDSVMQSSKNSQPPPTFVPSSEKCDAIDSGNNTSTQPDSVDDATYGCELRDIKDSNGCKTSDISITIENSTSSKNKEDNAFAIPLQLRQMGSWRNQRGSDNNIVRHDSNLSMYSYSNLETELDDVPFENLAPLKAPSTPRRNPWSSHHAFVMTRNTSTQQRNQERERWNENQQNMQFFEDRLARELQNVNVSNAKLYSSIEKMMKSYQDSIREDIRDFKQYMNEKIKELDEHKS